MIGFHFSCVKFAWYLNNENYIYIEFINKLNHKQSNRNWNAYNIYIFNVIL